MFYDLLFIIDELNYNPNVTIISTFWNQNEGHFQPIPISHCAGWNILKDNMMSVRHCKLWLFI